jgi:hypothetical protein
MGPVDGLLNHFEDELLEHLGTALPFQRVSQSSGQDRVTAMPEADHRQHTA